MKKNSVYTLGSLIILLICAFVFVILPAMTGAGEKQQTVVEFGKYNGKAIRYEPNSDFSDAVSYYGQIYQYYGRELDSNAYYEIFYNAFNQTVMQYAYKDAVEKSGYTVPKSAVTRQLIPYFSENGKYSSKLYRSTSKEKIRELTEKAEKTLFASRFYDDNFGSDDDKLGSDSLYGLKPSSKELDFVSNYGGKLRAFNAAVFALSDYPKSEKVAYGKANTDKFIKYNLSVISVEDKATAKTVAKRIASNEITFTDAVSEYSNKSFSNAEGKLTNSYRYQIENILVEKADMDKLVALSKDDVSDVIPTGAYFSIFKADDDAVLPDFDSDDTVNQVSSYITTYENSIIEDYFTEKAKAFTAEANKTSFKAAAAALNVKTTELEPFPLNYGNVSVTSSLSSSEAAFRNADSNENFLTAAFSLKKNEISEPLLLNRNVVVLQLTEEKTPDADADKSLPDLGSFDKAAAQSAILKSDKFENHFMEVYFRQMMNN
ncbi:peptidylprolyl isomerase [Treponema sp. C6A8]|uniref:peptidylprolyl isomerase n=1 Tax=Treponema sp. C6A8 TaxID=1410609 RepID=UPI0004857182|nr:SurA N-terminal domain-containing protein [Treponema sp. C6A8]